MSLWSKGVDRSMSGKPRGENDLTNRIEKFFDNQNEGISYEVIDDKNWVVNVKGNLHLNQSNLDEGKLFFKIGKLTGNLYFYGKHMSPSVIPEEMSGEIIFVPDEEELAKNRGKKGNNEDDELDMGLITTKSRNQVVKLLETAFTECFANGYDIDIQEILNRLKEEWENKKKYELRIVISEIKPSKSNPHIKVDKLQCDFYISPSEEPLNLSAIDKATYLLFILHKEGLPLNMKTTHIALLRKIYAQLSGAVQDTKSGIMNDDFLLLDTTLNRNRFNIRKEIQKRISNSKIIDEFAIEGRRKEENFKVEKATDELRKQIVKLFGLEKEFPNLV